ncbi:electron transfer flavoprotein beta subunit/FixA family protein [Leptospira bourretii]|uniref:Electron transfer flavoprotein subunit beta n=3 Tax=Leptospira TaxID=171 RepID=A0A4R9IMU7_9LEPT|nr:MULTISPECIES: electron transfer flavoprotein subunit beta/FixA family protein [Leptospira]MCW7481263.1 electron transfer flavoprotein subunit beta/FixA family protein [Leptospira kanakyensis]TGK46101.1 electron transfer flavoprotein beta subunit/FixA family protein [Leptospira kanakyensis]TGK65038.1 electron transfer flavoprotein beta subunit/FixA family protein [Leptospira kanakyensis]TGK65470.1 electron transfer flavoprotein beta subunit/FixA family protein [Leptospira kanakyensis]TGK8461
MKIVVLVKQVPDTETNIKVGDKSINEAGVKWIISPYDEFAIEEGIRIREKSGGEVIAVSLGPDRAVEALRTAYAMGVDRAVHVKVDDYVTFDSTYTSELLANLIKAENADVVIGGRQSIDTDSSQVVVQIAERLNVPHVAMALKLEFDGNKVTATREIEGGTEVVETTAPLAVTAQKGLNEPRYPSLKGIMSAKKKPVDVKKPEELGATGSKLEVVSLEPPPPRIAGRKLEAADAAGFASQLVKALREEAKVI